MVSSELILVELVKLIKPVNVTLVPVGLAIELAIELVLETKGEDEAGTDGEQADVDREEGCSLRCVNYRSTSHQSCTGPIALSNLTVSS